MKVNINSDNHIDVKEEMVHEWRAEISDSLQRFSKWITRVEVHLTDQNSRAKGGDDDIRCLMEARPAGQQPISIDVRAATVDAAIQEGIDTLERRLGDMADKKRTEARRRKEAD